MVGIVNRRAQLRVRELTPPGLGGVSVIQLEGPSALEALRELAPAVELATGAPQRVRLELRGEALDEALVLAASAEHVELHVHGNPTLVHRLERELGTDCARRGTARSSSLEQRAWKLLEHAASEAGARCLLDQAEGALRRELEELTRLDDDAARARLESLLEASRCADFALHPRRVVLAGPVNAGKSTLFNALFGRTRVVVSARAGTTRDVVGEQVLFGAWPVELFDTAGEREPSYAGVDQLERDGQRLGRETRANAQLVLWLIPASRAHEAPKPRAGLRVLLTHCDERVDAQADPPRISTLVQPTQAVESVHATFRRSFDLPASAWRSSAAVAFDAGSTAALRDAVASLRTGGDWRAVLVRLLDGG